MNMKQLSERTGLTPRQIRYLIAEGFMPPPTGGRTYAEYGDEHTTAIRRYVRLKELGFPPQPSACCSRPEKACRFRWRTALRSS